MRDELQSLGNSLFDFELQRIVIAAGIHAKVVVQVRRAASQLIRQWNIGQATDSLRDRAIRIDVMVEEGTCVVRTRSAIPGDASLIGVYMPVRHPRIRAYPYFRRKPVPTVIVEVNWCSTVAFHISMLAGRCTVGRIRGSTLFVGPRRGIVPLARGVGNWAGVGPVAESI